MSLLLQHQEPIFPKLAGAMHTLARSLMLQFITPTALMKSAELSEMPLEDKAAQLPEPELCTGFCTRQTLHRLQDEVQSFFKGVVKFHATCVSYALGNLP